MNVPHRITATGASNETTAYERSDTLPFVHAPFVPGTSSATIACSG
jgi:hypothetical protein